jgi:hypothetical protein
MPPEQDDYRERQLAALRRYVSDLDVRRQHNGTQARPAGVRRRSLWPWGGAGRDPGARAAGAAATASSAVAASPAASPECAEAVERANKSMGHAVKVSNALREHTEIMNDLLHGRIDGDTALRTGTPSLIVGSAESAKFDVALADYKRVVDSCQLQAP